MTAVQPETRPATLEDVPGWFFPVDRHLFAWLLERQQKLAIAGDLIEMGAYLGRSAIVIGEYVREGETFTVCDLFDSDAGDDENSGEMQMSYRSTLTRNAFDANYLAFHDALPTVVQAPTSVLGDGRIGPESCRFVHIDASHLYEHVIGDIRVARDSLAPDGVVVLDDYRTEHTPGVAAAAWEAVATLDLKPIVLSGTKMYATWGDLDEVQEDLFQACRSWEHQRLSVEQVRGRRLLRLRGLKELAPPPFRHSRYYGEVQAAQLRARADARTEQKRLAAEHAAARRTPAARAKRMARELLPPVATRAGARLLQARRSRKG
ncbi:hypothetical protein ABIA33_007412 [Streptacidiphilus sp. MAP12-16]|uniref:class I SAM-dependent methyltransferase n=1 Tax=Streptacidiphilus sp. MAP12-16 TaxID=3156300 RepID=UPI0035144223